MATVEYNFLSGSTLYFTNSLFFDLFKENEVYLGFARPEPIWGFSSLIKINPSNAFPDEVMGTDNDSESVNRFYDKKVFDNLEKDFDSSLTKINIAYIRNTDDASVLTNYTFLNIDEIGEIYTEYMNVDWMRVQGLDQFFLKELIDDIGITDYDFYIFNFNKDINSRISIEPLSSINLPQMEYPVKLMYNTDGGPNPSTALGDNIVGSLTKTINIFGESYIYGLQESFLEYIEKYSLTNATFFITRADGTIVQDAMTFIEKYESETEKYLLFSFEQVNEAVAKSGRLKLSTSKDASGLAIFTEQFSDGTFVSDKTPPPLTLNYLKSSAIQSSIFDVIGIVKIDPSEVYFARRIDNIDTRDQISSVQGLDIQDITLLSVKDNEETTVSFAFTDDAKLARENNFDLVKIEKSIKNNTLSTNDGDAIITPEYLDSIYRQLIVLYKPKDKDGNTCTDEYYSEADLFDYTTHSIDIGTIIYIANKQPVYREFLEEPEQFTLII